MSNQKCCIQQKLPASREFHIDKSHRIFINKTRTKNFGGHPAAGRLGRYGAELQTDLSMTTDFLEKFLKHQWDIIVDLNISITNICRLKADKYSYEDKIKLHGFFQHHWYQLKFISIIQLSKLFGKSDNDRRSFHKICSILESSPFSKELNYQLFESPDRKNIKLKSRSELRELTIKIRGSIIENSEIIERVIDARDKVYAHSDPKVKVKAIKSEDLSILIEKANWIHNQLTEILFNASHLHHVDGWKIDYILREMSEIRKIEIEKPEILFPSDP